MTTSAWDNSSDIQAAGMDLELVNVFCYLGSYIAYNRSCEKDVKVRIGKAATIFGKLGKSGRTTGSA